MIHEIMTEKDITKALQEETLPKISNQGIRFGLFWVSWDRVVGFEGDESARKIFWETNGFAKSLQDWIKRYQHAYGERVLESTKAGA